MNKAEREHRERMIDMLVEMDVRYIHRQLPVSEHPTRREERNIRRALSRTFRGFMPPGIRPRS